jgi:phospholipase/carboxylesterase
MTVSNVGPLRVTQIPARSPAPGGAAAPAILLCHGFGAGGDDLVPLAQALDLGPTVRWFFPEAPLELPWGGRAWWEIDLARIQQQQRRGQRRAMAEETPPGLAEARAALEATLDELERAHGVVRERLVIGGFSQGAMLTTEVAVHATRPFAGLALLSGTLLSEARWRAALGATGASLHAFVTHGRQDPLLPFEAAEALRDMLAAAGADVAWVAHDGQHEIPPAALRGLGTWARRRLGT